MISCTNHMSNNENVECEMKRDIRFPLRQKLNTND